MKNDNDWLILCDRWPGCLEKLHFNAYGIASNSNLRNQVVSKEIPSDLERKDIAEFSDKFSYFQYTTLEIFKAALNNYSMLNLFFESTPSLLHVLQKRLPSVLCNWSGHQTTYFIADLPQNRGRSISIFFYCHSCFYCAAFFHFPYEISNNII